jgi:glycosyltransferase involved in cell wall biosynthesis
MRLSGGFLYHRRLAELAPQFGARVEFISFPDWPFPAPFLSVPRVLREWRRLRPDATLLDSLVAGYFSPLASVPGAAYVGIAHQLPGGIDHHPLRTVVQSALDRFSYRRARALIACSGWLADRLYGLNPQIEVANPGCAVALESVESLDLRRGRKAALLNVANWQPVKDLFSLLEAFAGLPDGLATLHLVGDKRQDTEYGQTVTRRVSRPDLKDRVVIHGPVDPSRLGAFYASADLFCLTSRGETYGSVYAEALSAGLPVVGWRTGNLPHLVVNETEGLLVNEGDLSGLRSGLQNLLSDPKVLKAMSRRARQRGAAFPDWERTTQRVLEVAIGACA